MYVEGKWFITSGCMMNFDKQTTLDGYLETGTGQQLEIRVF